MSCTYYPKLLDTFMWSEGHGLIELIAFSNLILQKSTIPSIVVYLFMSSLVYLIDVIALDIKLTLFRNLYQLFLLLLIIFCVTCISV